jgi:hypothetical protein
MHITMHFSPYRRIPESPTVQCGNGADWDRTVSIWEWVKLIATALAISVAMTAVGAGAVWLIAK